MKLVIRNLEQIVTVTVNGELFKSGKDQDNVRLIDRRDDGVGCCFVANGDLIEAIGYDDELESYLDDDSTVIDGTNCCLIPGLVDAHTHPVWSGDRLFEYELKMKGATYLDIHNAGGGIYYTVNATRAAPLAELVESLVQRLKLMNSCGSTLVECKTGYGLDYETELKLLQALEKAKGLQPVELVTTYLGAHAIPKGLTADEATEQVISDMSKLAVEHPEINPDFVDVFCETGVYNAEQSRQILEAGSMVLGAEIGFHGDELSNIGSGELAEQIGARSVSHLEFVSQKGIEAMARSKTAAIILPTTAYLLRLEPPPVRRMIEANAIVALGSDFNPNAYCYSMPTAMNLAVVNCKMTLNEALSAATINSAYALNKSQTHGSLEQGKVADAVLVKSKDWKNIVYQLGETKDLIECVIKRGKVCQD
ncbi:putative imidazolonepropionase [Halotydeus destructor]|nr:putative imidazolonepropionase [Halotydeus destructor]